MRAFLRASLVAGLMVFTAATAAQVQALEPTAISAHYSGDGAVGVISIAAPPATKFFIRAERADGSYAFVGGGTVGASGTAGIAVIGGGIPNNGTPAWMVTFNDSLGSSITLAVAGPRDDDMWAWD